MKKINEIKKALSEAFDVFPQHHFDLWANSPEAVNDSIKAVQRSIARGDTLATAAQTEVEEIIDL